MKNSRKKSYSRKKYLSKKSRHQRRTQKHGFMKRGGGVGDKILKDTIKTVENVTGTVENVTGTVENATEAVKNATGTLSSTAAAAKKGVEATGEAVFKSDGLFNTAADTANKLTGTSGQVVNELLLAFNQGPASLNDYLERRREKVNSKHEKVKSVDEIKENLKTQINNIYVKTEPHTEQEIELLNRLVTMGIDLYDKGFFGVNKDEYYKFFIGIKNALNEKEKEKLNDAIDKELNMRFIAYKVKYDELVNAHDNNKLTPQDYNKNMAILSRLKGDYITYLKIKYLTTKNKKYDLYRNEHMIYINDMHKYAKSIRPKKAWFGGKTRHNSKGSHSLRTRRAAPK